MEICGSGQLLEEEEEVLKMWEEDPGPLCTISNTNNSIDIDIDIVEEADFLAPNICPLSVFSDFGEVEWFPGFGCEEDGFSFSRAKLGDSPLFLTEEEEEEDGEEEEEEQQEQEQDKGKNITTSMSALRSRIHARLRSKRRRLERGRKWGFDALSDNLAPLGFTTPTSLHPPLLSPPSTVTSDCSLKVNEFASQAPSGGHQYNAPERFSSSSSPSLSLWPAALSVGEQQPNVQPRRCAHCLVQKTPQWRAGPGGPKTLCNACGVRFKSGRLYPEYRPAKSPTFDLYTHSNSHKKVAQIRRLKGLQTAQRPLQTTIHGHHLG